MPYSKEMTEGDEHYGKESYSHKRRSKKKKKLRPRSKKKRSMK